ncbi:MAG TPA: SLC13 family permease [Aggregatilinea sp.]|uniref:SLC13 family permease n=1 Tax=Aggregatilinea sp. TaxID=2806333 RepID=UPI002CCB92E8|nr:SLC13 family permease [Aggregatilinea sp.]HML25007.1 SLC13 family permease [Aggregatilinea sp.]
MSWVEWYLIAVLAIPLGLALFNRLRADTAALIIAVALGVGQFVGLGLLGPADSPDLASRAISGFGQPVVVTLISLFIITHTLDKVGITRWIAARLLSVGGQSEWKLIALFSVTVALLSLVMNSVAAGALLLPSAMDVARRSGVKPSKLLMPIAYSSLLGGTATYFTTANIIISDLLLAAEPPQTALHILDFTPTGGLITIAGIAFIVLLGRHLLPDRPTLVDDIVSRPTGYELEDFYRLGERLWDVQVHKDSDLNGCSLADSHLGERFGVVVVAVQHGRRPVYAPAPDQIVTEGDTLLIVGREERVREIEGVTVNGHGIQRHLSRPGVALVEVVPAPHSSVEGQTLRQLNFRREFGCTVIALWHDGRSYRTDLANMKLRPGDSLLVIGPRACTRRLQASRDFIVLEPDTRDEMIQVRQVALASAITLGAIGFSIAGFPVYLAMLAGAILLFLSRLISIEEAYRSVRWQAIFLVAGMYSVSLGMVHTGLADRIGEQMVNVVTPFGPLGLAAGCFLLTALLAQVMGGQVTALVTGPVAISAALSLGTDPHAIAVATAIGCSASFLTPLAHPINVLVMGPANYRFSDFARLGWGLTIICCLMLILGMKIFWGL